MARFLLFNESRLDLLKRTNMTNTQDFYLLVIECVSLLFSTVFSITAYFNNHSSQYFDLSVKIISDGAQCLDLENSIVDCLMTKKTMVLVLPYRSGCVVVN